MYKIDDYILYRHDVCIIRDIKKNFSNNLCYILNPIDDLSLKIETPVDNKMGYIKKLLTKKEINDLIIKMPNIDVIDNYTEKNVEMIYKELFNNGSYEDLIKIIKTTYTRNDERIKNNKKISEKDDKYFKLSEKYLYNEFSVVLGMTFEETKNYVINKITSQSKKLL